MRVKICGIQNEAEIEIAVAAGAHAVGFQVGQLYTGKSFILPSTAARLAGELPPFVTPFVVTHLTRADEICELLERCGIENVQLVTPPVEEVGKVRDRLSRHGKIIVTEFVRYPVIDFDVSDYFPVIDAVELDCFHQEPAAVALEQRPKRYQWDTAAEFVKSCPVPVILTGALNAENVAEAIRQVNPFAVDACAGLKNPATQNCDSQQVRRFVARALHALLAEEDA